tara:strand:- start:16 stop:1038 length:1023 start_codon:yes stop_codon:yes gene_type:complete
MAYTTINKSTEYFNTKLYTGTGSSNAQTGVGFQPDLLWIKKRNGAVNHLLHDAIRGVTKLLVPNTTGAEDTNTNILTSFDSDGFTVGTNSASNNNGDTFASWNWKANGQGSANTDGSVSSTVSANATAGFSIVQYNTNSSGTQTIGHGLGSAPTFIITKPALYSESWYVYSGALGVGSSVKLNTSDSSISSTPYAGTPTNSVFSINNGVIGGYTDVISYCFTDVQGYSKFQKYIGTGSADGAFIYTGFKPAFVIIKRTDYEPFNWFVLDNKRNQANIVDKLLYVNENYAEGTNDFLDFTSNGFKLRTTNSGFNSSGATYIYMAFAEAPLVGTNNVPATAR